MNTDAATPVDTKHAKRRFGLVSLLVVAFCSAALAGGGVWIFQPRNMGSQPAPPVAASPTRYQCPMHPSVIQDHPGNCPICGMKLVPMDQAKPKSSREERAPLFYRSPMDAKQTSMTPRKDEMGMDYLPVYEDDIAGASSVGGLATVEIDPARQQLIGLSTAEVSEGPVGGAWRTVGRVAIDETRVRHINLKIPGFVERIDVDFVGKRVNKGDPLFSIYSPELLAAQEEYLLALKTKRALSSFGAGAAANDGESLLAAARRKLALWDVPDAEIQRLERTGTPEKTLTFNSPIAGVVTKKDVVEGMKLEAGAMPYEIVDLSTVWVLADVYESELRFVQERMTATLKLNAFPNREWNGKVVFIDPLLDPQTRTVKVRLTFPNRTGELRPEMFGEVVLLGASHVGLRVPVDAVIDSGTDKLVFVLLGEGKFQPRVVKLGNGDRSFVEVLSGLELGDRVVTRANFLIDSESRLRASLADMAGGTSEPKRARVLPLAASDERPLSAPAAGAAGSNAVPLSTPERHAGHEP